MDTNVRTNKATPWIALVISVIYAVLYVIFMVDAASVARSRFTPVLFLATSILSLVFIVFLLINNKLDRTYDPSNKRIDAVSYRYMIISIIMMILPVILQMLFFMVIPDADALADKYPARITFVISIITIYMIGFPSLWLTLRRIPKMTIVPGRMGIGKFLMCIAITAGLALIGTIIGAPIHMLLTDPFTDSDLSGIAEIMVSSTFIERTVMTGVLAPIFEELICRKLLIDRTIRYGEHLSILMSGIIFGLIHGNFQQFFFAMLIGMLFALIYIRTGRVIYTILLHATVNLSSSVVTATLLIKLLPYLDDMENIESLPEDVLLALSVLSLWLLFLGAVALTGIILLIVFWKKLRPFNVPDTPSVGGSLKQLFTSPVFLGLTILCLAQFAASYLPDIVNYFR
ncbi:MAG: CPBP family intramembrane metalloprotease [Clostridiales bacterium]|nr:CPBP family intramembrane metalloprotease [Clostridiales bacterium]